MNTLQIIVLLGFTTRRQQLFNVELETTILAHERSRLVRQVVRGSTSASYLARVI